METITIGWEWKYVSLIGDERVISLQHTMVYVSTDSVLCLDQIFQNHQSNAAWEQRLTWFKTSQEYRNLDRIDGEPKEFEWNIFPGCTTLQLSQEVKDLLLGLKETPKNFTRRIIFMSMFNDISSGSRDNEKECMSNFNLVSPHAKRFGTRRFVGPDSEKKWTSISEDSRQRECDNMAEKMMLEFAEIRHPIFRATSPVSRGRLKSKCHGRCRHTVVPILETIETVFRNCFCKSAQPLRCNRRNVWRVRNPSRSNRATRCGGSCIATIWSTNWKVITTKQIEPNLHGCRIFEGWNQTRFQDERYWRNLTISCSGLSWIHSAKRRRSVTTKRMDPREHQNCARIEKLQPVACTEIMELRSELCLWTETILTPGSEFLMDQIHLWWIWTTMNRKTSEVQFEENVLKLDVKHFTCRSEAKIKPQRREPANCSPSIILMFARNWIDIQPRNYSFSACEVSCLSGRWASSEPKSLFQSCFKEIFGGGRGDVYIFLEYDFSSFHPNNFRNTTSWKCFVKNDGVRSSLTELQSFPHSKIDVDPTHCVLMSLPCCMHVLCMTSFKSIVTGSLWFLSMGFTGRKNTVCLLLKFGPPGNNPELMMECKLIAHPWKKLFWMTTLSCQSEKWDCVLNVLDKLGYIYIYIYIYIQESVQY